MIDYNRIQNPEVYDSKGNLGKYYHGHFFIKPGAKSNPVLRNEDKNVIFDEPDEGDEDTKKSNRKRKKQDD